MLRWSLLLLAFSTALLGAFNVVKVPDRVSWKLAVAAGEFGHWFALLPLAVIAVAVISAAGPVRGATLALAVLAAALLLRPVAQAWWIGRTLPARLAAAFGRVELSRAPFSFAALTLAAPAPVAPEVLKFSGELALDFYRTAAGRGAPAPCVIVVHGGGWDGGVRSEIPTLDHWLARAGYAVADLDYRLAPAHPWPAAPDDIRAALAFLKKNSAALGLDPARFVLLGRSAGGQLAESVAYAAADPAIRGVVALYAPADVHFAWKYSREDDALNSVQLLKNFLGGPPETARAAYDAASPIQHVSPRTPPTLLVHGELDTLVWHRQSVRLAARLAEEKVPHAFVSLPWATHALEYDLAGPAGQLTSFALAHFLAAVAPVGPATAGARDTRPAER